MKCGFPFLSRFQLIAVAGFAAALLCPMAEAGMMHADIDQRTYTDFAQNLGRYKVTGVSTLLQAIRDKDGGIVLVNEKGEETGKILLSQGMIDFSGVEDMPGWFHGAGAALGNNYIVTAEHNSIFNASFGVSELGSSHAISYATVRESAGMGDFALYRQNKIFTDTVGASMYSGITTDAEISSLVGETIYRAGGGVHYKFGDYNGTQVHAGSAYTFLAGGIDTIAGASFSEGADTYRINWEMDLSAEGVSTENPLPITTNGGDSGSPIYVYNEETKQYEYLFALTGDNRYNWSIGSGAITWTADAMAEFNKAVDMSSVTTATLGAVSATTEDKAATGTITVGEEVIEFLGVASGTHTWKSLTDRKNVQNWYAYGNHYQNGISGLGNTHNLVFTGSGENGEHTIILNATVDTGIGYLEFNAGKFTIESANGQNYMLNSAGYVINKGAEVHLKLANDSETYMREWRKNGEGNLYIEGRGNTNALLTVGGSGKVYLQRENGYSAYNVLASSGATVVIQDIKQIARDFTFGLGGATLDMNGNSMDWYTTNTNVGADGFSINALTDEAVITNTGDQTTTLTYKQGGETTFKGSFRDTEKGAIKIVADAGENSVWTLNGIATDLSKNTGSGFEVRSGKVVLSGTNTVHGKGSVNYSDDVFFSEDDWHYADAQMKVAVEAGAVFELGSHARLKGDVTVNGGIYVMREGVRHQMEYIEGGLIKENTYAWEDYYGHHGNTVLNNGTLKVEFSAGTTANTTYAGDITGNGTVTVDAGDGTFTLTGNNTFTGDRSVVGGILIVEDAAAAGSRKWKVEEKGVFTVQGTTGADMLAYVDEASDGVLALGKDDKQFSLSTHKNLIVGALAGQVIQYGEKGTSETLTAVDKAWRLGGGGGELVVNYHLTGENKLILGNAYAKGIVTLTNEKNDFTGGIDFMGSGVTLKYSSEAAIEKVTLNLSYGNRVAMTDLLKNVTKESNGILLQYNAAQSLDLSEHKELSLGANGNLNYTGEITVAEGQAYRFSAADGTFTVNSEIGGAHDIVADAQTYTGGTVKFTNLKDFTGALSVAGYDSTKTSDKSGTITLEVTQDNVLNTAKSVTVKAGGTLNIGETTQTITNLVLESGATLYGNRLESATDTKASELHLTIDNLSDFKGTINVATIHKYGESTLTLDGSANFKCANLVVEEGDVQLTGMVFVNVGGLSLNDHTLYLNGQALYLGVIMEDGGRIDASAKGSSFSGYSNIKGNSGIAYVDNGGNNLSLSANVLAAVGATIRLEGSGKWTFSAAGYNTVGAGGGGTLQVEAPSLTFANASNLTAVGGTLELLASSGSKDVTIDFAGTSTSASQELNFNTLLITEKDLKLEENTKTNAKFSIGSLNGSGSVTWNADQNSTHSSRLVFTNEGNFNGKVTAKRTGTASGYSTFVELAHEKALKTATLDLQGVSGGSVALAVNADNAQIQGLLGNEHSVVYGGAALTTTQSAALTSTKDATLTITGSGTYDYKGAVAGASIAMAGTGTQTFSGNGVVVKDVSALSGTLVFSKTPTLNGNIAIAQGATLSFGESFTLNAGHTLSAIAGASRSGTANLTGTLVLNGGTLGFDASVLNDATSLLSATLSFGNDFSKQTISFTNESLLEIGKTYKLLDGNWTGRLAVIADSMPDYLKASAFSETADGLSVTLALANGFVEWKGDYSAFSADKTVLFRGTEAGKDLNFTSASSAKGLRFVNGESYTFSGQNLTLSDALVLQSGKLTLNNKLTTSACEFNGGALEIARKGELVLTNVLSASAGSLVALDNISGEGTLQLKLNADYGNKLKLGETFVGTTHVLAGNLTLTDSSFGSTLKLAGGVNAQITAETTFRGNLELEGTSQIHQNGSRTLTLEGNVSGTEGVWQRMVGGTLNLNGNVDLKGFITGANAAGSTNNFNGEARISTVTLDKENVTVSFNDTANLGTLTLGAGNIAVRFNGEATADTVSANNSSAILGGSGTLRTKQITHNVGSTLNLDGLRLVETEVHDRVWTGNNTTTVNLKNGAVLDTRLSDYSISGSAVVGGDNSDGTMYVNGIRLSTTEKQNHRSQLNVTAGSHLIISGESAGTSESDFVLGVYGQESQFMSGSNQLIVDGNLTSNASMTLCYKSADVNVGTGGRLNLLSGLELKGPAYNEWISGGVKANLNVASGGKLYAAGGTQRSELVVNIASGATLGAIGEAESTVSFSNNMTWGTANTEGTITIDTAAVTVDNDFNLTRHEKDGVTLEFTGTLNLLGTTSLEVVGAGTLKYNSAFDKAADIRLREGASLAMDDGDSLKSAVVLDESSLILDASAFGGSNTSLAINTSGTIHATAGASTLSATTTLNDGANVIYDVAAGATLNSTAALVYSGERASLTKSGAGILTLNDSGKALTNISAEAGTLKVCGVENYMLTSLSLSESAVVGFYTDSVGSEATEASISVWGTAQFSSDAHLEANLILAGGSTLEVAEGGLSMGSTLTLEQGALLGEETLARANALKVGESLTLFTGVDQLILGNGENAILINPEDDWSSGGQISVENYFSNLSDVAFELCFTGEAGNGTLGILAISSAIPEPSAFGLFAGLGALALVSSRRRRK